MRRDRAHVQCVAFSHVTGYILYLIYMQYPDE